MRWGPRRAEQGAPDGAPEVEGELLVHVDRDSVAMGDDAVAHGRVWSMPATATTTDLVLAVVRRRVWASVAGPVAWLVQVVVDRRGPLERDEVVDLALVRVDGATVTTDLLVRPWFPVLLDRYAPVGGGPVQVHLRYLSWAGRPMTEADVAAVGAVTGAEPTLVSVDDPHG